MDTTKFIQWVADVNAQLDSRKLERETEREDKHRLQAHLASVIDKMQLELMDASEESKQSDLRLLALERIADRLDNLLQGTMGRPGMVAQVGEHEDRLSKIEKLLEVVSSLTEQNGKTIEKQSAEMRWMQRVLYIGVGIMALLQFLGWAGVSKLLGA